MQPPRTPIQWVFALLAVAAVGDAVYALFSNLLITQPQRVALDGILLCGCVCVVLLDQIRARLAEPTDVPPKNPRAEQSILPSQPIQSSKPAVSAKEKSHAPPAESKPATGAKPSKLADDFLKQ